MLSSYDKFSHHSPMEDSHSWSHLCQVTQLPGSHLYRTCSIQLICFILTHRRGYLPFIFLVALKVSTSLYISDLRICKCSSRNRFFTRFHDLFKIIFFSAALFITFFIFWLLPVPIAGNSSSTLARFRDGQISMNVFSATGSETWTRFFQHQYVVRSRNWSNDA